MGTCLQDGVLGGAHRSSCRQDIIYDDDRSCAELVGCTERELERAVNVCQALCIRELCLKKRPTRLEQEAPTEIAAKSGGEDSGRDVGEVMGVCPILDAEPWNGYENWPATQWKGWSDARQHPGELSRQLVLAVYLHLQDSLSQCSFIPVGRES